MASFYDDTEIGCLVWEDDYQPQFVDFDFAQRQPEDHLLPSNISSWINLAEHVALASHMLICADGFEVLDQEQPEEGHGEELADMYPSDCTSSFQARLTAPQAEELRRRASAPSSVRNGRRRGYGFRG
jgi:hypothetical protein